MNALTSEIGTKRSWRCGRRRSVVGGKAENIYSVSISQFDPERSSERLV